VKRALLGGSALVACAAVVAFVGWACNTASLSTGPVPAPSEAGPAQDCPPCTTHADCTQSTCAQIGSDSFCMPICPHGNECTPDRACVQATTVTGERFGVCVPRSNVCSAPSRDDDDAGAPLDGGSYDAGGAVTGTVTASGGKVSRLYFAVAGDTRPASIDQTSSYPSATIGKIFDDITSMNPRPSFVIATGDYMYASPSGTQGAAQLDLYLAARSKYPGVLFPALGNHECTGATASNCGPGTQSGSTANYTAFMTKLLAPIQQTNPYYAIEISALDGKWTSKFVFVAANAWTSAQASWLDATMAKPTTYTFVVRHEPSDVTTTPGVPPSDAILAKYPYTLLIVGHTHTYSHYNDTFRQVTFGNGGAPLTGSRGFGYGVFNQLPDGRIQVDALDVDKMLSDARFRFAVKPDGTP
jgi:hypothetical protein